MWSLSYVTVLCMSQGLPTARIASSFALYAARHTGAHTSDGQPHHQLRAARMHGVRVADDGGYTIICPERDMHPKLRTCVLDAPCSTCVDGSRGEVGTWMMRHGEMHVADASGAWCVVDTDACGLDLHAREIDDAWVREIATTRGAGTYLVNCVQAHEDECVYVGDDVLEVDAVLLDW